MKLSFAWAKTEAQNQVLKTVSLLLVICLVVLACALTRVSIREPLVIDRGCGTSIAMRSNISHTEDEIRAFAQKALVERFNTDAVESALLSEHEQAIRTKELTDLKNRSMSQRVFLNSIKVDGSKVFIDADRLISVGSIRTGLPLSLVAVIASTARSEENPFGLVLLSISSNQDKDGGKKDEASR